MFKPFTLYIGLRYTRAKKRSGFISFISLTSTLGIALGVTTMITVLSVMNGFDRELQQKILGMAPHISVSSYMGSFENWRPLATQLELRPDVLAAAPFIRIQGVLKKTSIIQPVLVQGILPSAQKKVSIEWRHMLAGRVDQLKPGQFGIVLSRSLADNLGVYLDDKVILMLPQMSSNPAGIVPRLKRFQVVGIFEIGAAMDAAMALIHLQDAARLKRLGNSVHGLRLKVQDLFNAPAISRNIATSLRPEYRVSDWTQIHGNFFKAVKMEKTIIGLMLFLIIAVAAFNIVSTLVMMVNDKRSDIAILRTIGATPLDLMWIFIIQGFVNGLLGALFGMLCGVLLATNVSQLVQWIESFLQVHLVSADVYLVGFLPSELHWPEVGYICLAALIMSLSATLYPAWVAAQTQPAEALRYE